MYAIFLRLELFCVLALFAVVDLEGIIVASYNGELACVVEVERSDGGARASRLEALDDPLVLQCDSIPAVVEAYSCWPEARYDVAHFLRRRA